MFEYVYASKVRQQILTTLREEPLPRRELVDVLDASKPAVYKELNGLDDRGFVAAPDDVWRLTGIGIVITDVLAARGNLETVVEGHPTYWADHDTGALPPEFRLRLGALAGADVHEASDSDPYAPERRVNEVLRSADPIAVASPFYSDRFAQALFEQTDRAGRLLATPGVIDRTHPTLPNGDSVDADWLDVRVASFRFALVLTDALVMVSLPTFDGSHAPQTVVEADSAAAVQWGRDLFERTWTVSTSLADHLHDARETE